MTRHLLTVMAVLWLVIAGITSAAEKAERPDTDYIARLFLEAWEAGRLFPDILRINPDLDDPLLYEVQKKFVAGRIERGAHIGGYKGGFIPKAPIGGVLFQEGMLTGSPVLRRSNFRGLLVEAEISFRFCKPVTRPLPDVVALRGVVCTLHPAVELPDAALPNLRQLTKDFPHLRKLLIATNVAASHVLLGPAKDATEVDINSLTVRVLHNGKQIGFRDGRQAKGNLWRAVLWVVNNFVLKEGYTIKPDHIIIPGNLTGLHPGKPGDYVVDFGELGVVTFSVVGP